MNSRCSSVYRSLHSSSPVVLLLSRSSRSGRSSSLESILQRSPPSLLNSFSSIKSLLRRCDRRRRRRPNGQRRLLTALSGFSAIKESANVGKSIAAQLSSAGTQTLAEEVMRVCEHFSGGRHLPVEPATDACAKQTCVDGNIGGSDKWFVLRASHDRSRNGFTVHLVWRTASSRPAERTLGSTTTSQVLLGVGTWRQCWTQSHCKPPHLVLFQWQSTF